MAKVKDDTQYKEASPKGINRLINVHCGEDFEEYCAYLLKKNGYTNIQMTSTTGDHGIDILAEKDFISYAIQCKYYSVPVGNKAVQEAYSGRGIYKKDIAVVMTNNRFTKQAIYEAQKLGVKLWDGDIVANQLNY